MSNKKEIMAHYIADPKDNFRARYTSFRDG